jgi:hypothetical protein
VVSFTLRLDDELHAALKALAGRQSRSLHGEIILALRSHVVTEELQSLGTKPLRVRPSPLPVPSEAVSAAPVKTARPNNDVVCVHRVPAGAFCKICDG